MYFLDNFLLMNYSPSDCSGGYSSSILDAIRQSLQVSNVLALDRDQDYQRISYKEAFRMATLGGAKGEEGAIKSP